MARGRRWFRELVATKLENADTGLPWTAVVPDRDPGDLQVASAAQGSASQGLAVPLALLVGCGMWVRTDMGSAPPCLGGSALEPPLHEGQGDRRGTPRQRRTAGRVPGLWSLQLGARGGPLWMHGTHRRGSRRIRARPTGAPLGAA